MRTKIVLFGAGANLKYYIELLSTIEQKPDFLCDNDKKKWGKEIEGYLVLEPNMLISLDCEIIISCTYEKEIRNQLVQMGIGDKISSFNYNQELRTFVDYNYNRLWRPKGKSQSESTNSTVVIDAFDGIGWGGMEIWSYQVGEQLAMRKCPLSIIGATGQKRVREEWEQNIVRFDFDRDNYWGIITDILDYMEQKMPIKVISNWTDHVFVAAYILKKYYSEDVKIYSVVHNDFDYFYEKQLCWGDVSEKIVPVSLMIRNNLIEQSKIQTDKIVYKENFIPQNKIDYINYRNENEPIRIGWGARVEILQKRADRIVELVNCLETQNVNYRIEIAGDGGYIENLKSELNQYIQAKKVTIWGKIDPESMPEFWKRQNIYINLSDYEGTSLAMLEAMSYGCVPIVTKVSGVDEFVSNGENGYSFACDAISDMAVTIKRISLDEQKRRDMSRRCQHIVEQKCDLSRYVDFIMNELLE